MKKFLKENWFTIVVNIAIVAAIVGGILYTLTYKAVPVEAQHQFYGTNLHSYLVFEHAITTGIGILALVVVNIVLHITEKRR